MIDFIELFMLKSVLLILKLSFANLIICAIDAFKSFCKISLETHLKNTFTVCVPTVKKALKQTISLNSLPSRASSL